LQRFLSVLKTGAPQYCNKVCSSAWKSRNNVELACPICAKKFKIKPSRAEQNETMTCGSRECIGEIRRRQQLKFRGIKPEDRIVKCSQCGKELIRKPSHIKRFENSYCSVACKAKGQGGEHIERQTRKQYPCETCGTLVWRSPATLQPHTFCSRKCAAIQNGSLKAGIRLVEYVTMPCSVCGDMFDRKKSMVHSDQAYCSTTCRQINFIQRSITANKARTGLPGFQRTEEQRATLSSTLKRKYQNEWLEKGQSHAKLMSGSNNPAWLDGRSNLPYTEGFFKHVKRHVMERDNNECQSCGKPKIEPNTHVIHHLDWQKVNHDPSNLLTLCHSCHGKLHGKSLTLRHYANSRIF